MRYRGHESFTIPLVTERRGLALVERGIAVSIGCLYWLPHFALGEPIAAVWYDHEYTVIFGFEFTRVDARIVLTANAFQEALRRCWPLFLSLSLIQ